MAFKEHVAKLYANKYSLVIVYLKCYSNKVEYQINVKPSKG